MPKERSVSFGDLVVIEFELGVGDNPSVSGGVPIALSRNQVGTYFMKVDEFEDRRPDRRPKVSLKMDRETRMRVLLSYGCDEKDIAEAVRTSRNIRHSRERSMYNKGWDPVHEVAENALRKVTKPFRGRSTKLDHRASSISLERADVVFYKERQKQLENAQ